MKQKNPNQSLMHAAYAAPDCIGITVDYGGFLCASTSVEASDYVVDSSDDVQF